MLMFTGIVEEVGKIKLIRKVGNAFVISISADEIMSDIKIGDSIAVNGICLTVTCFDSESFTVDVMGETVSRTSLSLLKAGGKVNLERAMPANGRFGGHIVSGHIDGTGTVCEISEDGVAKWYKIKTLPSIMKYIVEKGSVAIDGISLTVAKVESDNFSVSVIPHTMGNTTLCERKINDIVNLENDCIGKYVERLMNFEDEKKSYITRDFLAKHGF